MGKIKKSIKNVAIFVLVFVMIFQGTNVAYENQERKADAAVKKTNLTDEQISQLCSRNEKKRGSVHDPSIIKGEDNYYVFGSHMGVAKTSDLMNWDSVDINGENADNNYFGVKNGNSVVATSFNNAFNNNEIQGETTLYKEDGSSYTVNFSTYNLADWISTNTISGNMWAPDVVYNKEMKKWCMYLSLNGPNHNSAILLLTADDIEGPYVYQAPIVFSGFYNDSKSYQNTDLNLVIDNLNSLPSKYNKSGNWGDYWPHAIDPCVFYDEEGKLWLSYGSWSGGIYVLELDEKTGLRDYSVSYESDYNSKGKAVTSDEYFGKKIAGGCYVSGEGSYIQHIGDYYYLFMSYGFYSPTGGYNMRIFRSENPDGPYVDLNGTSAIFSSGVDNFRQSSCGLQLMGNYQWNSMNEAEVAQGHNSAYVDDQGRAFVIYHTKFGNDTADHELRVHQLFTNEDGWIVAAPYEFDNETVNDEYIKNNSYSEDEIAGDYDVILHQYNNSKAADAGTIANNVDIVKPKEIRLTSNGQIKGDYSGSWTQKAGSSYITITIDSTEYKGVLCQQTVDGTSAKALCFTAVANNGVSIWGSKMDDQTLLAYNAYMENLPNQTKEHLDLSEQAKYGSEIDVKWKSSNEDVITENGSIIPPENDTNVVLTKTISKGKYSYSKDYNVKVTGKSNQTSKPIITYSNMNKGEKIKAQKKINQDTGVSLSFTVSNLMSDWTPIMTTDSNEYVYLSILNYGGINLFEASASGSNVNVNSGQYWQLFLNGTYDVTISYNTDGSIVFYRNGVKVLTYDANTQIGSSKVSQLASAMIDAVKNGALKVKYDLTNFSIDYAKDYDGDEVNTYAGQADKVFLDSETNAKVVFTSYGEVSGNENVYVNGSKVTANSKIGLIRIDSIDYEENRIVVNVSADKMSGWHDMEGRYTFTLKDSQGNELASDDLEYNMEELSADTDYMQIKTADNDYAKGFYKFDGTKMYILTMIKSKKIHCDGKLDFSWRDGISSEMCMTILGKKYYVGSHVFYNSQADHYYSNAIFFGTDDALGTVIQDGSSVVRGFLSEGTFDDDSDIDSGCALLNVVDFADADLTEMDLANNTFTFSGNIGPNDGGNKCAAIDEDEIYKNPGIYTVSLESMTLEGTSSIVDLEGGGIYGEGESVTVTAPDASEQGLVFLGWYDISSISGDDEKVITYEESPVSSEREYNFTIDKDRPLVAIYKQVKQARVNIETENEGSFSINNGNSITSYNGKFNIGDTITLKASDSENVLYWKNGNGKIISDEGQAELQFKVKGNANIVLVAADNQQDGKTYIEFVNPYDSQIISSGLYTQGDSVQYPTAPSRVGYNFISWDKDIDTINNSIGSSKNLIVNAVYEKETAKKCNLRVHTIIEGQMSGQAKEYASLDYGSTKLLEAEVKDGYEFNYWSSDAAGNEILSMNDTYLLQMTKDTDIYAIYKNNVIEAKPTVEITDIFASKMIDSSMKLTATATRSIPSGYTLLEQGILYTNIEKTREEMKEEGADIYKFSGSNLDPEGMLNLSNKVSENTTLYYLAYVVVENSQGEIENYYSSLKSGNFSELFSE